VTNRITRGFHRLGIGAAVLVATIASASAMDFTVRGTTVHASGEIVAGDARKFAALPPFTILELEGPGGLVTETAAIADNIDLRGGIRTVVRPGASCASACAAVLFVAGATRVVYPTGRLGIHSCANGLGIQLPECNHRMAERALAHGVPWGVIGGFADSTPSTSVLWFSGEDAECWGFMKWSAQDESNAGIACFIAGASRSTGRQPVEVTAQNANDINCRLHAGTSRIYVPDHPGFTDTYRRACEKVVLDPKTPKYAAIDILLWLTLTDPNILTINPASLVLKILPEKDLFENSWKGYAIAGLSAGMHNYPGYARDFFQSAVNVLKNNGDDPPKWLTDRLDLSRTEAAKTGAKGIPP
jgi:hypothetical protein